MRLPWPGGNDLPRPIDLHVKTASGNFAVWVIDKRIHPDDRDRIENTLRSVADHIRWVFTEETLKEDGLEDSVDLTTTHRQFKERGRYDRPFGRASLHFLLREPARIKSYRGLRVVHSPQRFSGQTWVDPLSDMLVVPSTGEIVHPGDHERLAAHREEMRRKEKERCAAERRKAREQKRKKESRRSSAERNESIAAESDPSLNGETGGGYLSRLSQNLQAVEEERGETGLASNRGDPEAIVCRECGRKTSSWTVKYGQTGEGKCRKCLR